MDMKTLSFAIGLLMFLVSTNVSCINSQDARHKNPPVIPEAKMDCQDSDDPECSPDLQKSGSVDPNRVYEEAEVEPHKSGPQPKSH